ncbi:adenosylcobalamin-dependent ribonucleoside-diphosphate reductase [Sinimarinibacterium sp. CAU 1509]|uniref:adenosylcobalamin-dependent ribonucleoside-diphosphate reductase n=1 Tax=Sinimarinibacterium sp. CAU 1509 TaxID=2562283 RepID=UPI0010ACF9F5|nr:adenosylcobalamin-dependent ribonucleoside-diphosphate reductase [Sinimarinibacterium sp. CAU 1509]TJY57386.1 adenosylcobalamin-dependent ribonucleoside-diphosphate reductase [Sinimarinibacterium sp. CAU 1509]
MKQRPSTRLADLIPMQEASDLIAKTKYYVGKESSVADLRKRVAAALAAPESDPDAHLASFEWALQYAFPGGRVMANAGAGAFRPATSTINCTVSQTIRDSMGGIMEALSHAAITLKGGSGIGYDFTTIRPRGARVAGAGASTSGILPFMDMFDAMCKTVSSAGGRRGAQMGVLEVSHPDIEDFIKAKRENGRLRAFNLSVNVTRAFIDAANAGDDWPLVFPLLPGESESDIVWRDWPVIEPEYRVNALGEVACRVYRRVSARDLRNLIEGSTYEFSDPGYLLLDEANRMNPLWFAENLRATNPCAEQFLPPEGSCLLGSVNLAALVQNPFTPEARFDYETFAKVVFIFARMLDNVVEINGLPLEGQRREIQSKRRHGMGYLGLGSALTMMGIRYGSPESVAFTNDVTRELALNNWRAGLALAKEKGAAPILTENFVITPKMLRQRPELAADGYKAGDTLPGRVLHAKYSVYMQQIAQADPELVAELAEHGSRFTHATSIAPTGTMAASVGNNASNGIEPSFAHSYIRNMIVEGEKTKRAIRMESYELLAYRKLVDANVDPDNLPELFEASAKNVTPAEHIAVQAAAQRWIDSAISKTTNCDTDMPFAEFQGLYQLAIDSGLKGCTTFRFNPEVHMGVLVEKKDLDATVIEFKLDDGSTIRGAASQKVRYDNAETTIGNLYEALKEGQYGKH